MTNSKLSCNSRSWKVDMMQWTVMDHLWNGNSRQGTIAGIVHLKDRVWHKSEKILMNWMSAIERFQSRDGVSMDKMKSKWNQRWMNVDELEEFGNEDAK